AEREPLEVDRDVRVLLDVQLDALVEPRPLLRIVEGPERELHRRLLLRQHATARRKRQRGSQTAEHVTPAIFRHGSLPSWRQSLLPLAFPSRGRKAFASHEAFF